MESMGVAASCKRRFWVSLWDEAGGGGGRGRTERWLLTIFSFSSDVTHLPAGGFSAALTKPQPLATADALLHAAWPRLLWSLLLLIKSTACTQHRHPEIPLSIESSYPQSNAYYPVLCKHAQDTQTEPSIIFRGRLWCCSSTRSAHPKHLCCDVNVVCATSFSKAWVLGLLGKAKVQGRNRAVVYHDSEALH